MDSITQFTLGATISTLFLGNKVGPRKAAMIGGILGTIPDLDVLLPYDTPIDSFVFHRGWSHSILLHFFAAPVVGELLLKIFKTIKSIRITVWATVFLCLSTHAVIDAMTIYGTRLFWPLYLNPIGFGSIFIIDPLYSLPLLLIVIWAFTLKNWSISLKKAAIVALTSSTAYLAVGLGVQFWVEHRAKTIFDNAGIEPMSVLVIAAPFTNLLWKVIGLEEKRYHNLYISIFDNDSNANIYTHSRHLELIDCLKNNDDLNKLKWFSRGFYKVDLEKGKIVISDLRMGLTPNYAFRFAIADYSDLELQGIPPSPVSNRINTIEADLVWLSTRFFGYPALRMTESNSDKSQVQNTLISC